MSSEKLKRAIIYIRQGEMEIAQELILGIIEEEPSYEKAWIWLVETVAAQEEKLEVLNAALEQNPDSALIKKALSKISKLPPARPPVVEDSAVLDFQPVSGIQDVEFSESGPDEMIPTGFGMNGIDLESSGESIGTVEDQVGEIASEEEMLDFFKNFSIDEDVPSEESSSTDETGEDTLTGTAAFFPEAADELASEDFFGSAEESISPTEGMESRPTSPFALQDENGLGIEDDKFDFFMEEPESSETAESPGVFDASQQTDEDWMTLNALIGDEGSVEPPQGEEEDFSFLFTEEAPAPEPSSSSQTSPFAMSEDEFEELFGEETEEPVPTAPVSEPAFPEEESPFFDIEEPQEESSIDETDMGAFLYEEPEPTVDHLLDFGDDLRQEVMGPPASRAKQVPKKPSAKVLAKKKKKENQTFIVGIAVLSVLFFVSMLGLGWIYWQSVKLTPRRTPTPLVSPTEAYTLVAPWLNGEETPAAEESGEEMGEEVIEPTATLEMEQESGVLTATMEPTLEPTITFTPTIEMTPTPEMTATPFYGMSDLGMEEFKTYLEEGGFECNDIIGSGAEGYVGFCMIMGSEMDFMVSYGGDLLEEITAVEVQILPVVNERLSLTDEARGFIENDLVYVAIAAYTAPELNIYADQISDWIRNFGTTMVKNGSEQIQDLFMDQDTFTLIYQDFLQLDIQ